MSLYFKTSCTWVRRKTLEVLNNYKIGYFYLLNYLYLLSKQNQSYIYLMASYDTCLITFFFIT